jgi:anti-sigma B factor antagonist
MKMPPATLETALCVSTDGPVITLYGDIDGDAEGALAAAYDEAVAAQPGRVLLDFGGVGYINSTGIALIVGLLARARANRRAVAAVGLSDHYREIFEITRISEFMTILAAEGQTADKEGPQ